MCGGSVMPGMSKEVVVHGIRSPADGSVVSRGSVAGEVFVDPQIFEKELDLLFEHRWLPVALDREIPHPGDYVTTFLTGESVIVVRQNDQSVTLLVNVCRHCARPVVQGAGRASRFTCDAGGWVYGLDGRVEVAGGREPTVDPVEWGLVAAVAVARVDGIVYASWGGAGAEPDSVGAAGCPPLRSTVEVAANWKCTLESLLARPDARDWLELVGVHLLSGIQLVAVTPLAISRTQVTVLAAVADAATRLADEQRWTVPGSSGQWSETATVVCANTGEVCEGAVQDTGGCPLATAVPAGSHGPLPRQAVPPQSLPMYRTWAEAVGWDDPEIAGPSL